jgi:hypothetical protein
MSSTEIRIERSLMQGVPGGFIAFGSGSDIDQAFDAAVTIERFELGTNGQIPSLADVDPAADRVVRGAIMHPHQAIAQLLDDVLAQEPGIVLAQAVAPLNAYKHERRRFVLESLEHNYPQDCGLIVPLATALRAEVEGLLPEADRASLVGIELVSAPRRRFKVGATPVRGPRQTRFAIMSGNYVLELHDNQAAARKAAMLRAKEATDALELEIRPYVSRNDGEPFLRIQRRLVTQRATVKAVLAAEKNPQRQRCAGWIFAGRLPN